MAASQKAFLKRLPVEWFGSGRKVCPDNGNGWIIGMI